MDYNITYRDKNNGIQVVISYKDADGKWKQKTKQGFENSRDGKRKAKLIALEMVKELSLNSSSKITKGFENITIGQLKEDFLDHIKIHREFGTWKGYKESLYMFDIDDIKIKDLKIADVQKCINKMVDKSAGSTIKRKVLIFKIMLNFANTQYNIPIISLKNLTLPSVEKPKKRALTKSEQKNVLEFYNNQKNINYYIVVLLALKAGLRIGEICGLTWEDINFDKQTITINKQWKINKSTNSYDFGPCKSNNSYRTVPISKGTISELLKIKNLGLINEYRRILTGSNTTSLTINLNRHIQRNKNITIHELRHTYATNLISNGLDFKTAAKLLGHDIEQTMKTYSHVTDDMLKTATIVIDKLS